MVLLEPHADSRMTTAKHSVRLGKCLLSSIGVPRHLVRREHRGLWSVWGASHGRSGKIVCHGETTDQSYGASNRDRWGGLGHLGALVRPLYRGHPLRPVERCFFRGYNAVRLRVAPDEEHAMHESFTLESPSWTPTLGAERILQ